MSDREMLELAAKAAGIGGAWDWPRGAKKPTFWRDANGQAWNPLDDDGDALRLAVKLGLTVAQLLSNEECLVESYSGEHEAAAFYSTGGREAATRRAIVRAAAEIGRNMT